MEATQKYNSGQMNLWMVERSRDKLDREIITSMPTIYLFFMDSGADKELRSLHDWLMSTNGSMYIIS